MMKEARARAYQLVDHWYHRDDKIRLSVKQRRELIETIAQSLVQVRSEALEEAAPVRALAERVESRRSGTQERTRVKWGSSYRVDADEEQGYLKDDTTIAFAVPCGPFDSVIRVRLIDDGSGIIVSADGTLRVTCQASNKVYVRITE